MNQEARWIGLYGTCGAWAPVVDSLVSAATSIDCMNGEFVPAVNGSFKGESDFGQVEVPIGTVSKVVFK